MSIASPLEGTFRPNTLFIDAPYQFSQLGTVNELSLKPVKVITLSGTLARSLNRMMENDPYIQLAATPDLHTAVAAAHFSESAHTQIDLPNKPDNQGKNIRESQISTLRYVGDAAMEHGIISRFLKELDEVAPNTPSLPAFQSCETIFDAVTQERTTSQSLKFGLDPAQYTDDRNLYAYEIDDRDTTPKGLARHLIRQQLETDLQEITRIRKKAKEESKGIESAAIQKTINKNYYPDLLKLMLRRSHLKIAYASLKLQELQTPAIASVSEPTPVPKAKEVAA